jgi:hypothetical protein
LLFINITSPLQAQPADNKKAIRSHAARRSHHNRWLQKCGITDSGGSEGLQKAAQRQRNVLQSQCQCPVNARLPVAARNRADVAASSTYNLAGLARLVPLPSIPKDARVWNMVPLPSLPPSNLTPSFLNSDSRSFGAPYEQRICSLCGRPLRLLKFQQRQPRPKHTNNPAFALGTGHADPFASLPIEIQPCMWLLIDNCKNPSALTWDFVVRMFEYIRLFLGSQIKPYLSSLTLFPQFKQSYYVFICDFATGIITNLC